MELTAAHGLSQAPTRPHHAPHGRLRHTPRSAARPAQPRARRTRAPPAGAVADEAQPYSRQQPPEALHAAAPPDSSAHGVFGPSALAAAAHSAPAFARVVRLLVQRGSGATEAHLVAAWTAQRRSPALRLPQQARQDGGDDLEQERQALEALVLLEELTRQQLLALAPDQLGFVARCYVLAGGASKPLLLAIQHAACGWAPEDYSAAGFAELAWALAACGQPLIEPCRQLLRSALGGAAGGAGSEHAQAEEQRHAEQQAAAAGERQTATAQECGTPPQQEHQQQQPQPQQQQQDGQQQRPQQPHDWAAWFKGTPASRVVLLLWAAAQLDFRPCSACLAAAVATLARDASVGKLPTKSLVTLLWSLATLRAAQQRRAPSRLQPLLHAVSGQLAHRMEAVLGIRSVDEQADSRTASGWYSGPSSSGSSCEALPASEAQLAALPTDMLCTVVWACGQLRHADTRLLQAATVLLHGRVDDMDPADMTRALWGLGHLGFCPAPLLTSLSLRLQQPGALAPLAPRQLALVSYAFAALDFFPGQDAVDSLADAALAARTRFQPRELAHVLWNMSRLGYMDDPFYLAFVPVILMRIDEYSPAELADIARVYSRCGLNPTAEAGEAAAASLDLASSSDEAAEGADGSWQPDAAVVGTDESGSGSATLFDALARQTVARIQGADLQDILRILTAFHQMGLQPDDLLDAVETWANQRLRKLSPQALALALWSFARMGSGSPGLLETAAACAEQQLEAFTPPQLAKVTWAFAKLDCPAPRVLRHAGSQLAARTSAFNDKEASNVLWALASQEVDVTAAELDAIAANLQPRLRTFGPQSLANIAWAFTTLGHCPPPPFLQTLGTAALPQLPAFEPQGLSLLVWSLASLGCRHIKLLNTIVLLCVERPSLLRQFEGQHLANLLWGLTRCGFRPLPAFLDLLAQEGELRVRDFKPQELMNTAWAFTQLGHHPARLFEAIAREVALQAFAFSPQELSATLWALAKARHAGPAMPSLLHAVEREVAARGTSFEPRDLAILTWSCGQLGHLPSREAAQPLWALLEAEVGGMPGRTLATLAAGLAALEEQQQWQWQQQEGQQQQQEEEEGQPQAAARGQPTVPPQLVRAVAERAVAVFAQLQPFEAAQLVLSLSVLGSQEAAEQLLRSPSTRTAQQLLAAAERAPLPDAVGLLWSMARWACYPAEPFAALCTRLRQTSKHYRLPQAALARLGQAWQAMGEAQQRQLRLRGGLRVAAYAAAQHVALHGPPGSSRDAAEGAGGSGKWGAAPPGHRQQQQGGSEQRGARGSGQADSPSPAAPQPSFDLENEEDPSWLEMTFEDLAQMAG